MQSDRGGVRRQALKEIANIAAKNNIIVLSDEIYEKFSYDGPCETIVKYCDRAILLRGFGKTYGVTGWRLGYAAAGGEDGEVIDQMIKIQQYTFVCVLRLSRRQSPRPWITINAHC